MVAAAGTSESLRIESQLKAIVDRMCDLKWIVAVCRREIPLATSGNSQFSLMSRAVDKSTMEEDSNQPGMGFDQMDSRVHIFQAAQSKAGRAAAAAQQLQQSTMTTGRSNTTSYDE
jgi:hypothetical protein